MKSPCTAVSETLPWLLNGSLSPKEEQSVLQHLENCDACRQAFHDTAWVQQMSQTHPPAQDLALVTLGAEPVVLDRQSVIDHLAECVSCQAEVEMIRAEVSEPVSTEDGDVLFSEAWVSASKATPWTRSQAFWQMAAVLALLVGSIFVGGEGRQSSNIAAAPENTSAEGIARLGFEQGFVPEQMASKGEAQVMVFTDGFEGGSVGDWPSEVKEN